MGQIDLSVPRWKTSHQLRGLPSNLSWLCPGLALWCCFLGAKLHRDLLSFDNLDPVLTLAAEACVPPSSEYHDHIPHLSQ